jgi:stage V sporulation protein K
MSRFKNPNKNKHRYNYYNNSNSNKFNTKNIRSNKYKHRYNYFNQYPIPIINNHSNQNNQSNVINNSNQNIPPNIVNNPNEQWIDISDLFNLLPNNIPLFLNPENTYPPPIKSKRKNNTDGSGNTINNQVKRDASGNIIKNKKPKLSDPTNYGDKPINILPGVSVISITRKGGKPSDNLFSSLIPEINKALNEIAEGEKDKCCIKDSNKKDIEKTTKKTPLELTDDEEKMPFEIIDKKIETIADLIQLGKDYETIYKPMKKKFNLNVRVLADLVQPLEDLNTMIGMENIKKSIFNKIIMYLQGLENTNKDFLHTVICGSPGMGKTDIAKIMGRIYAKMGFLSNGKFIEAKLTDLKGGFLGQSELKTQKLLDEAKGNVLFFDEAYSLGGSDDKIDSYSQSIIDVLNPFMDKYKNDFVLIIAGYKDDLLKRFFKGNQGLRSRFGLWLEIDPYKAEQLRKIFIKKVLDYGWKINEDQIKTEFFEKHKEDFKFFGRDMENLFSKCKIAHAKRVLYCQPSEKKILNEDDLLKGFKVYKNDMNVNKNDGISDYILNHMFL